MKMKHLSLKILFCVSALGLFSCGQKKEVFSIEAVDLGLSVKWASCNIGADSIGDFGDYYAWGETEVKTNYSWDTYKWCNGSDDSITKYCTDSDAGKVDNKTTLDPEDDVAHEILGGDWRMPTIEEFEELINECSWKFTKMEGAWGYIVTGPSGRSIFLPAAGGRYDQFIDDCGTGAFYWSSTFDEKNKARAYGIHFSGSVWNCGYANCSGGHTIRPVSTSATGQNKRNDTHEPVDLGLSVKWATCNVGANSPEEYGDYYAWGETEVKSVYDWDAYKWCNGNYGSITKYCIDSDYGDVDHKTTLDLSDDIAYVKWGGKWRMPTSDELRELHNNCHWKWTLVNGVAGWKVIGSNGNSIFLPAAGYRYGTDVHGRGSGGKYWSATLNSDNSNCAYVVSFDSSFHDLDSNYNGYNYRSLGSTVRPVTE